MSPKKTKKLDVEKAIAAAAAAQLLAEPVVPDDATTVSNVSDRGTLGDEGNFDEEEKESTAQVGDGHAIIKNKIVKWHKFSPATRVEKCIFRFIKA